MQADLASLKDSQKVIDQTMERFGRVDILLNNAAVFPPSLFVGVSEKVWDETIDTDLKGAFFLAQFAAKAMISGGRGGRIIKLLSTDALAAHRVPVGLPRGQARAVVSHPGDGQGAGRAQDPRQRAHARLDHHRNELIK